MTFSHRRLDPRPKAAVVVGVFLVATAAHRIDALAAVGGLVALTVAAGRDLRFGTWVGSLSPFRYLLPIILVVNAFFYGGGEALWGVSALGVTVEVTTGGVRQSALIALRLLVIAGAATWFGLTTEAPEFERSLVDVGVPWRLAFVFSLTVRLVPTMRDLFRDIEDAQRSRGLTFEGGPLARARARIPMFVPFLASVIQYGYDLAEALEVRDFGRIERRTYLVELEYERTDYLFYAYAAVLVGAFVWLVVAPL
jgi:energy-coupling factor transport system permease protein